MSTLSYGWPDSSVEGHPIWEDPSFADLVNQHPELGALRGHLSSTAMSVIFEGQPDINTLQSSYAVRGYGSLLYALIRVIKPLRAVEIGIFQGFSLLSAAAALRDNGAGQIVAYDLFDAYPYRHVSKDQVSRQILASGLERWATVHECDAAEVHEQWQAVDYLHVDVSNTGDTYRRVFAQWSRKVRQVILLEGGSGDRDNVDWMRQYGKPAIAPAVVDLARAYPGWSFTVLQPFPSLTVACNRTAIASGPPR